MKTRQRERRHEKKEQAIRSRQAREHAARTPVDLSIGSAIDIYGTAAGMGVRVGGRVVGDGLVGGRLMLGARMVAPGIVEFTSAEGEALQAPAVEGIDKMLSEAWDGIADYAGINKVRYVPEDIGPVGEHVAEAWRTHCRLWREAVAQ